MHVIGVTNQKGGVGKTTTAINLAAALAERGEPTLLVDLDPQGNASSGAGLDRSSITLTSYEAIMGLSPIEGCIYPTKIENLSVLPADMRLIAVERELADEDQRELRLSAALRAVSHHYRYVIVDSPPSLGLLTLNVLRAVEHLVIPVQSEYYALEGLSTLVETVRRIQADINPRLEVLGLVMTMVDSRTNLARQVVEEVLKHFGDKVFRTVIARSVRLSEAPSFGESILTYDSRSSSAEAHRRLAQEVVNRLAASPASSAGSEIPSTTPDRPTPEPEKSPDTNPEIPGHASSNVAFSGEEARDSVTPNEPNSNARIVCDKDTNMTGVTHGHEASPGPGTGS